MTCIFPGRETGPSKYSAAPPSTPWRREVRRCIQLHPPCSTRLALRNLMSLGHLSTQPASRSRRPQIMASLETVACTSPPPSQVLPEWRASSWTSCKSSQVSSAVELIPRFSAMKRKMVCTTLRGRRSTRTRSSQRRVMGP